MATILLAKQAVPLLHRLENGLKEAGHQVILVGNDDVIGQIKSHPFDLIILNVSLPDVKVDAVIRQIRLFSDVPVVGVCAPDTPKSDQEYMENCMDRVIQVPMSSEELNEFVQECLRDSYRMTHDVCLNHYKNLKISSKNVNQVEINNKGLDLTIREFMILSLLMRHRRRIYTKPVLYETVWKLPYTGDDNALKIHISNLRSKLRRADPGERYVETVWGQGYRLCKK